MVISHEYIPQLTCSKLMKVSIEGVYYRATGTIQDVVKSVEIIGGCDGNRKSVAKLCVDMRVSDAIEKLQGITCDTKHISTSCGDQLSIALGECLIKKYVKKI